MVAETVPVLSATRRGRFGWKKVAVTDLSGQRCQLAKKVRKIEKRWRNRSTKADPLDQGRLNDSEEEERDPLEGFACDGVHRLARGLGAACTAVTLVCDRWPVEDRQKMRDLSWRHVQHAETDLTWMFGGGTTHRVKFRHG